MRRDFEIESLRRELFLESCLPVDPITYAAWLFGYVAKGGKVTHFYDRSMPRDRDEVVILVQRVRYIPAMHGANSMIVLIPEGLMEPAELEELARDGIGHSTFCFIDGYKVESDVPFVPSYAETSIALPQEDSR